LKGNKLLIKAHGTKNGHRDQRYFSFQGYKSLFKVKGLLKMIVSNFMPHGKKQNKYKRFDEEMQW